MVGIRWNDWNTMPTRPRRKRASPSSAMRVMSVPAMVTRPPVAVSRPAATISSDDLPDPDGPEARPSGRRGWRARRRSGYSPGPPRCSASGARLSSRWRVAICWRVVDSASMTRATADKRYGVSNALLSPPRWGAVLLYLLGLFVTSPAAAAPIKILALGTSLTQGYGVAPGMDFTAVLEARLRADHLDVKLLNAGESGDTSAGGLSRIDWSLADHPDAAIVELGSNEALLGHRPAQTEKKLTEVL